MKYLIITFWFVVSTTFASNLCYLDISTNSIDFGQTYTSETKEYDLVLSNNSSKYDVITIEDVKIFSHFTVFKVVDFSTFTLSKGESKSIKFSYSDIHNITCLGTAFIRVKCGNNIFSVAVDLKGKSVYKDEMYGFTQELWEDSLRNSLIQFVKNHKSLTYTDARILMWSKFDRFDEQVECVYTGKKTYVSDEPNFSELDSYGWNTEHTWPQTYGASNDPERSDLFHIYITDKKANEKRGNYPFGQVSSGITWQEGGSKLGKDASGNTVFEPRNAHQGNVARSLFYFAIKYGNKSNFLTSQETALREFNFYDIPDARERARNDSIAKYQLNRNPFIDHPELVYRMPSIALGGSFEKFSDLLNVDNDITVELKENYDSVNVPVYFYNLGNSKLKNAQIEYSTTGNDFEISSETQNFQNVDNTCMINLKVKGKPSASTIGKIKVTSTDDNSDYVVSVFTKASTGIENNYNSFSSDVNIFPNPMFDYSTIEISNTELLGKYYSIKLYNLLGEEVLDLTNYIVTNNRLSTIKLHKNELPSNSNVFIFKLCNSKYTKSKLLFLNN